ncbi:hypothetical protein P170DRAFT_426985 [Aspergillus steynii IBT 23096]|uniref:Uncharacterized protein n=1 Tax=Aspergillus steynii IBT 23096 TaxID=1392250 RepID=A0A2I2G4H4_9EURO|nr:uncharacterized protein P170DRAFT_426985 [Aspergillus steynii IBT 23096]PLB47768.1 hypothetical protein P170DRAFT_426985 [Aspergillus steynii IBT 23096]
MIEKYLSLAISSIFAWFSAQRGLLPPSLIDGHKYRLKIFESHEATDSASRLPTIEYESIHGLRTFAEQHQQSLELGYSRAQFIKVTRVPGAVFTRLDKLRLGGRLSYDSATQELVIRLIPSTGHERSHGLLMRHIERKLSALGVSEYEMDPLGASTIWGDFTCKQANSSLRPLPQRSDESDAPTLVIECGTSKNKSELQEDAIWWLTGIHPPVNIVILIFMDLRPRTIKIEVWKMQPRPADERSPRCRIAHPTHPAAVSKVKLRPLDNENTYHASRDLRLSFRDIMLRDPPVGGNEIVFSTEELERWAKRIYDQIHPRWMPYG